MQIELIKARVAEHKWWHCIDLGNGIVTPGACHHGQSKRELSARWGIPDDLSGKSILDIGCWDGLFSLACLRRGARRVNGVDELRHETFNLVMDATGFGTKSSFRRMDAQDPMPYRVNIALCFGVLYHVERPLEVIRNAIKAADELVIIETALAAQVCGKEWDGAKDPIRWVQARGYGGDSFNIWYPTPDAVLDAMRVFGCAEAFQIHEEPNGSRGTFVGKISLQKQ